MTYKFRAWHKERGVMYEVRGFLQGVAAEGTKVDGVYCAVPQYDDAQDDKKVTGYAIERFDFEEVETMQSLGINDIEGKEIFDGDILEAKLSDDRVVKRLVVESKAIAGYEIETLGIVSKHYIDRIKGKVVGNVFQNGEFLTGR